MRIPPPFPSVLYLEVNLVKFSLIVTSAPDKSAVPLYTYRPLFWLLFRLIIVFSKVVKDVPEKYRPLFVFSLAIIVAFSPEVVSSLPEKYSPFPVLLSVVTEELLMDRFPLDEKNLIPSAPFPFAVT